MKKVVILCSIMFASFSFANANVTTKNDVHTSVTSSNSSQIEVKLKNGKTIKVTLKKSISQRWRVEFQNACGDFMIVFFDSDSADGSSGFINDLSEAVNSNYDC